MLHNIHEEIYLLVNVHIVYHPTRANSFSIIAQNLSINAHVTLITAQIGYHCYQLKVIPAMESTFQVYFVCSTILNYKLKYMVPVCK